MATNNCLVDEFENSFESCLASLTSTNSNHLHDSEEIKTSVEQCIQKFLDSAKQMEAFFLQKRLLLASQKPEQIILEDINELKSEIARKDQIIQRNYEKLQTWQSILCDSSPVATVSNPPQLQRQPSMISHPQQVPGQQVNVRQVSVPAVAGRPVTVPQSPVQAPNQTVPNMPANIPSNMPPNMPGNIPANMQGSIQPNMTGTLPGAMSATMQQGNIPGNIPGNIQGNVQGNMQPNMSGNQGNCLSMINVLVNRCTY